MFAARTNRPGRWRHATRLQLVEFTERVVPAVILSQLDLDADGTADDIRITGDLRNNKITIHDDGQAILQIQIDANGDGDAIDGGDLNQMFNFTGDSVVLEIASGAGNDSATYIADANLVGSARTVTVDLGGGNDAFLFEMSTHS